MVDKDDMIAFSGIGLIAILLGAVIGIGIYEKKAKNTYRKALIQYADTDRNGIVTNAEGDAFDSVLFKDKGITLTPGDMPRYSNGRSVSWEKIAQWTKEYKPSSLEAESSK